MKRLKKLAMYLSLPVVVTLDLILWNTLFGSMYGYRGIKQSYREVLAVGRELYANG